MTIDKATIINWALGDIGAGPMFSVDDDSDLAEQIENMWQFVVDRTFGLTDWSFALKTFRNNRNATTPQNGYSFCFDLPGGRIGNPLKYWDDPRRRSPVRDFSLEEGKLFCDVPDTWSRCKVYVDPDIWPPEWRSAFVLALGAYLAIPVWQDKDMRDDRLAEAFGSLSQGGSGGVFGRLMGLDKASQPQGEPLANDDLLTNARFSGGHPASGPWHGSL